MSQYIDAEGKHYVVPGHYKVGDFAILGDNCAFKISSAVLGHASPVFRDMLSSSDSGPKEVYIPDASSHDLALFLVNIRGNIWPTPLDLDLAEAAYHLLLKYECVDAAKRLLYHVAEELEAEDLFKAFVLASQLDDLITGCRIIAQGYRWYQADPRPDQPSLAPGSGQRPWKAVDAAQVRSSWVWALTLAFTECAHRPAPDDKSGKRYAKPHYWRDVVGAFMANLTR